MPTPTTLTFTSVPTLYLINTPFNVTIRVHADVAMPSVRVHFYLDEVELGINKWTSPLINPAGQTGGYATVIYPAIATSGIHVLTARYNGDATFDPSEAILNINVSPTLYTLTYTSTPIPVTCTINGLVINSSESASIEQGQSVSIVVPIAFGQHVFDHWEDLSTSPSRIITMTNSLTITAYYVLVKHTVSYSSTPIEVSATIGGASVSSGQGIQVDNGVIIQITVPSEVVI